MFCGFGLSAASYGGQGGSEAGQGGAGLGSNGLLQNWSNPIAIQIQGKMRANLLVSTYINIYTHIRRRISLSGWLLHGTL